MEKTGLVFLPVWGAGHLTSMLEFAKRLLTTSNNNFSIKILLIQRPHEALSSTSQSYIQSLSTSSFDIHFEDLPPVEPPCNFDGAEDFVSLYIQSQAPFVKAAISSSSIPISALVVDFFATTMIDVANELDIPTYIYNPSTALMLGFMLHLPTLDDKISTDFGELNVDIQLPGISPIPPLSTPSPLMKKNQCYAWFLYHGRRFREAKGIIVNTFAELEHQALAVLADGRFVPDHSTPPVYSVGPILSDTNMVDSKSQHECITWLDRQPLASVVFLCFGSLGYFGASQVLEMASGLEQSGHRFLWSLRSPPAGKSRLPTDAKLDQLLPQGFLERTHDRGMVWPSSWVPQMDILAHPSVGGFVTHCGWNSVLESLWFGVPMLAWPLYAEQHLNAVELVRDLGVAVGLKTDRKADNYVVAAELERGVRSLLGESEEGKGVRAKAQAMRLASRKAVEKGGSSYVYLQKLAKELGQ